jgi:hypothetical protein
MADYSLGMAGLDDQGGTDQATGNDQAGTHAVYEFGYAFFGSAAKADLYVHIQFTLVSGLKQFIEICGQ